MQVDPGDMEAPELGKGVESLTSSMSSLASAPSGLPESNYRRMEFATGEVYVGCVDAATGKVHGVGVLTHLDRSTYRGEFRMGKKDGLGVTLFANGDKHVGDYRNNIYHGHGTYTRGDGSVSYTGGFAFGKFSGEGVLKYHEKDIMFRGEFEGGEKTSGIFYFADGTTKRFGAGGSPISKMSVSPVSLSSESEEESEDAEDLKDEDVLYPISRTLWTEDRVNSSTSQRPTRSKTLRLQMTTSLPKSASEPSKIPSEEAVAKKGLGGILLRTRSFQKGKIRSIP
mmetsp:Transcript_2397/g.4146  ORF Transcript_2397/g.4146 Transcript_2397/m.4146 type:complete len:283 (-) Transcript_2397:127-975(-)|eukprot:CAMPEP_0184682452 /NCGR_PEP_ID=MMETSP0312-20130426/7276_1 /TAXON_ID=31354 /ORGANISM="Compsopogon coeruleus, Strain SAG 36.94" /LENGTH=282 /DNA_ID=CAMNT_0027134135 /DNA_START=34 /DNA_END=882 /DNA_ORIENTATION=+